MRQQYHVRRVDGRRLIWDVNRLVELTKDLSAQDVLLSEIAELDECYWFDETGRGPTCREVSEHARLIQETDLSYPIILCSAGRVMDGMHRVAKAHLLGRKTLPAVRFVNDPEPDYFDVDLDTLPYD